jgi:hypothetical protein
MRRGRGCIGAISDWIITNCVLLAEFRGNLLAGSVDKIPSAAMRGFEIVAVAGAGVGNSIQHGHVPDGYIRKYDGEPFMPHHIVESVKEQLAGRTKLSVPTHEIMV